MRYDRLETGLLNKITFEVRLRFASFLSEAWSCHLKENGPFTTCLADILKQSAFRRYTPKQDLNDLNKF